MHVIKSFKDQNIGVADLVWRLVFEDKRKWCVFVCVCVRACVCANQLCDLRVLLVSTFRLFLLISNTLDYNFHFASHKTHTHTHTHMLNDQRIHVLHLSKLTLYTLNPPRLVQSSPPTCSERETTNRKGLTTCTQAKHIVRLLLCESLHPVDLLPFFREICKACKAC
jgi:hypothetical protein